MKITVLVDDNSVNLPSEHGLSMIVETADKRFIVDFGSSDLFVRNAETLGISLDVDFAVISHNHNDHNGGGRAFMELFPDTKLYLGDERRMTYGGKHFPHYKLGIDNSFYSEYKNNICFIDKRLKLDNIYIINIPYNKNARQGKYQYIQKCGLLFADDYKHEVTVCVFENKVLNIISPCTHKGVVHTITECLKVFKDVEKVNFIGGLHTKGRSKEQLNCPETKVIEISKQLKELNINMLYLGHCTGDKAVEIIKDSGLCVEPIYSGAVYEL